MYGFGSFGMPPYQSQAPFQTGQNRGQQRQAMVAQGTSLPGQQQQQQMNPQSMMMLMQLLRGMGQQGGGANAQAFANAGTSGWGAGVPGFLGVS